MLSLVGSSHYAVGLGEAGESVERPRVQSQTTGIGGFRELKFGVQAGRIAKQEPQLRIARVSLCGLLCIVNCLCVITTLQCQLGSACKACGLNIRSPTQRLALRLRLTILMGRGRVRLYLVSLRVDANRQAQ